MDCPARFPDAPPTQILKEQGIFQSSWQHPDQQVKPGPTADTQWLLRRKHLPKTFDAKATELSVSLKELRISGSPVNAIPPHIVFQSYHSSDGPACQITTTGLFSASFAADGRSGFPAA